MDWRFEQPLWMWLAAAAVPLALAGIAWFAAMSRVRRVSAIVTRGVLLALLAAMLAGLSSVKRTNALAVVAVVDASESVRRFGREQANLTLAPTAGSETAGDTLERVKRFLAANAKERGAEDLLGVVAFDGAAYAVASPTRTDISETPLDVRGREGTNLADAIRLARAMIPPDASGRLLLISDGVETAGDALAAASETAGLARRGSAGLGVPIDVVPIAYDVRDEVLVEAVDAPPTAASESTITVRVTLRATSASRGVLRLLNEGRPERISEGADPTGRRLELSPGVQTVALEVRLDTGRVHRFKAVYEPDPVDGPGGVQVLSGDTLPENNSGESFTITPGRGSALLVSGVESENGRDTLAETLKSQRIDVTLVRSEEFPQDLLALQAFDLVILENVPAESLSLEQHTQLVAYVKDLGGGLIMVGGPDSFGAGGWRSTAVEPILPVRLDLPDAIVSPEAATLFVIDNSGSMGWNAGGSGRSKQEIANQATSLAISRLDRSDMVGVITFNNRFEVVIPLEQNKNATKSAERVREIGTNGGTNMGPALREALRLMKNVEVKQKHIVVLSDGRSMSRELLPGIAGEIGAAGIKLSTIAVGDDADVECMDEMAKRGKGVFYPVMNPNLLPKIFLKAVRVERSPLIRESPFQPVPLNTGSPLWAGLGDPSVLGGLVLTQPRPEPTITLAMVAPGGEPVLAHWNVELGRVAAFTSDASRWAEAWTASPLYAKFWTQAVRQMSRPNTGRAFQGVSDWRGGELRVRVDAVGDDGRALDFLEMPATVYSPTGEARQITLQQTGPGVYEASAPAGGSGTHVTIVRPRQGSKQLTPVVLGAATPTGPELRTLKSNEALLEKIASATGGRVLSLEAREPVRLWERAGLTPREAVTAMWRTLLIWAIAMLLFDVATRRVAWDRWVSKEFGGEIAAGARAALAGRGGAAEATVGGLKSRLEKQEEGVTTTIALGEEDAKALAAAARDRRRAARMAEVREAAVVVEEKKDEGAAGGLLAAKKRAGKRFEEEK